MGKSHTLNLLKSLILLISFIFINFCEINSSHLKRVLNFNKCIYNLSYYFKSPLVLVVKIYSKISINEKMFDLKAKYLCFSRVAEGNKDAFDEFFAHYYPRLIQFAIIYVKCPSQAEDVVSDVITNLLVHRQRVFVLDHFESYLYSSVKNKALNTIKKQQRHDVYSQGIEISKSFIRDSSDPHELLVEKELHTIIQSVVQNFPPKRKMVFQLIREEDLSYRQVAHLMNISERTVEVHLKLAVKSLRENVEQFFDRKKAKQKVKDLVKIMSPMFFMVL